MPDQGLLHPERRVYGVRVPRSNRPHPRPRPQNRGDGAGPRVVDTAVWGREAQCQDGRMTERRVSARIGGISESATLAVDTKAKALKAAGRPVIGFGAGEADFPTPDYIVDAAVAAARDPKNHRYSPAGGLPELKQAIADKTKRDSGYVVEPAQVLVTNGGKHAVYNAFATVLDPGDEVLLPAPYWTTYPEAIRLGAGGRVRGVGD